MFGVNLLLTTPSCLGRAWQKNDDPNKWREAADKLPFSSDGNLAALLRMELLAEEGARDHARYVADALVKVAYSGSEPHPDGRDAATLIELLKAIDAGIEKSRNPLALAAQQLAELQGELPDGQRSKLKTIIDNVRAAQSPLVIELQKR
jgi:hypothetical protein